ncbi:hypothetical protein Vafri_4860, partial [Volvox africanus]
EKRRIQIKSAVAVSDQSVVTLELLKTLPPASRISVMRPTRSRFTSLSHPTIRETARYILHEHVFLHPNHDCFPHPYPHPPTDTSTPDRHAVRAAGVGFAAHSAQPRASSTPEVTQSKHWARASRQSVRQRVA